MENKKGLIYNIQRFSIYDGPGIRTVVFFKGCNLRCLWCHNPESISFEKQLMFYPDKCIGCGECFKRCPHNAHYTDKDGTHNINRELCTNSFNCVDGCYAEALTTVGQQVDIDYLKKSILTDLPYFKNSNGGVTFSGGECMLQIDFLKEILTVCKQESIHTAIDTTGCVPWSSFEKILDVTDLFLYDIKAANCDVHKKLTGMPNKLILENIKKLSDLDKHIIIRIPFIPGANDGEIENIAKIVSQLNVDKVNLLPYHKLGVSKNASLHNNANEFDTPSNEVVENALEILKSYNINATKN